MSFPRRTTAAGLGGPCTPSRYPACGAPGRPAKLLRAYLLAPALAGLAACTPPDDSAAPTPPSDEEAHLIPLSAPRLLRRMSLDLRGVLPSPAELDAVEADAAAFDRLRDAWLDDPRLEERVVEWLAERWHTRVDTFDIRHYDYGLADTEEFAFEQAVGEEPLRARRARGHL